MNKKSIFVLVVVLGLIVLIFASFVKSYFWCDMVVTKVTDAQMTKVDGRFMIATEYGPLQNHDAWYRWKFNSGTIQNEAIKLKGKTVQIEKYGWRVSLFSAYENVRTIKEVKEIEKK
jgi:hypothetical protein